MQFQPGQSGNPKGRPKGSYGGRIQALAELDQLMGCNPNKKKLRKAMQESFDKDPMGFFKTVIMPLLPKESKVKLDEEDGVIRWQSLLGPGDSKPPASLEGHADRVASTEAQRK
jgi:hypothetical protein